MLEVNKGGLVRLDQPAATVFVANFEISDIQVKSPPLIYLMGKRAGETSLFAVDDQERVLAAFQIHAVHDLCRLRQAVKDIHPAVDLELASVGGAVIVQGRVPMAAVAEDVRRLASRFIDEDGDVVNRLAVTAGAWSRRQRAARQIHRALPVGQG